MSEQTTSIGRIIDDYRVVDNLSFPILHPEWGADEEILLLEAVDIFGLGNWVSVADHVANKTAQQCKQHYFQTYIDTETFPYPVVAPELSLMTEEQLRFGTINAPSGSIQPSRKRLKLDGKDQAVTPQLAESDVEQNLLLPMSAETQRMEKAEECATGTSAPVKLEDGAANTDAAAKPSMGCKAMSHKEHAASDSVAAAPAAASGSHSRLEGAAAIQTQGTNGTLIGHKEGTPQLGAPVGLPWAGGKELNKSKLGFDPDGSGYHFKRHDFDPEWDNDAECVISDMEFTELDTEEDRKQKLRILEIYNKRLDERERRRAFLASRNLIRVKHYQSLDKRRTPQEKEMLARLRVFARYGAAPGEHEQLVEGILLESRLRARLQELKEYRRHGIRTLADADVFETERRRSKNADQAAALAAKAVAKSRLSIPPTPHGAAGGSTSTLSFLESVEEVTLLPTPSALAAGASKAGAAGAPVGRSAAVALSNWRSRRGVPLDITCLPGVELLSRRERELCALSRLLPVHYLALKDLMLRDCQKHGAVSKQEARTFFRLDATRCLKLYELWTTLGWVSAGNSSNKGGAGAPHNTPLPPIPGGALTAKRLSGSNSGLAGPSTGLHQGKSDGAAMLMSRRLHVDAPPALNLGTPGPTVGGLVDWGFGASRPGSTQPSPSFGLDLSAFSGSADTFTAGSTFPGAPFSNLSPASQQDPSRGLMNYAFGAQRSSSPSVLAAAAAAFIRNQRQSSGGGAVSAVGGGGAVWPTFPLSMTPQQQQQMLMLLQQQQSALQPFTQQQSNPESKEL
ncbi:hypothetical protein CEUSTIGMA_g13455.t1 [Chlamydomonas eustigma]|uniref:Transcriptional adapter n=1 Tax=Chlamydomonas eustigma TaxID=1157962 RepID=A0A250XTB6_9CHLO|nr:hypothetical protein CEUSTIGMA_g13455.t1 [Chlamydomonas eustigma]|eukprot:GAX86040.1 hypothetical protein CEUSTIGMA_g13455.t1 [Chlamydomonas eustigma]